MSNTTTHRGHVVARVLDWLRAGYPDGIPHTDHVALFGLLHRRLTEPEVELVARTLASERTLEGTDDEIRAIVRSTAHENPDGDDINRVRACLARGGWPLADPGDLGATEPETS